LATHPQGLNWMQKWERLVSSMGFRQSITIAISVGLVVGLFLHLPFVRTTEEHVSRGALQLAATALYPVRLAWFHYFMCYLAVIANIIWPFLILKSLIQKWLFVGVYAGIVWMPAVCIRIYVLRSWQPDRPAFAALPLAYGLHKKQTTLGFHVFTVVRLIILCCLAHSVGHSNTDNFQKMENVTVFPVRQFYHFKASLSNSRMSESEKWLVNTYTTLYCNPSHLPRWVAFPSGTHWMLPQRGIFYTFRGSVEIMTMLWGVMTLCVLPWPCKQKRIDAQEETALFQDTQGMQADPLLSTDEQKEPINNIEELVNQIEQAAAQGRNLEELTGERELNESLPSWLREIWPSYCGQQKTRLRLEIQPVVAEDNGSDRHVWEDLPQKLMAAVAWATEISESIEVEDGKCKVFYVDLPKGSLIGDTIPGLHEKLQQALSPHMNIGTLKIAEVRHVQPVGKYGLWKDLFFIALDVFTDVWQIINLYMDEFYVMGGTLFSVFVSSLVAQCFGGLHKVYQEYMDSLDKGFKTNGFLRIVDREKGFEGFMSLALSCYIVYWQVNATSCFVSLVSIMFSGMGVATYLFNTVCL